ncbi:Hsp70 family protein [Flavobacterium sp.]|uniref:Hsp70 family protein n=1 Tax=Flavobacterium sp. TaxID=239 RepID=UPI00262DF11F|nr:Hsp70 family protein [Flavobacterium sp.]
MKNINFGIDLGTTNSGFAKYENGKVVIYKNPVGFRDTVPSVVSFRKGRIQIGEKAREHLVSNSESVFASFKRKMGSDESYFIKDTENNITPIELSSMVLKELINFAQGENPKSTVITIPASFDTIQTNATKKAGYLAGFEEVVLLQEPIAACLAYSNAQNLEILNPEKWLVYDFGGGTFDVAVVYIDERELKVIDHKGNNFLGGVDLDNLFVEKVICPKIEESAGVENLWQKMIAGDNADYKKLYFELLFKAEEAKKELSLKDHTSIEVDSDNLDIVVDIDILRAEFEASIAPKFEESFQLTENLLKENNLHFTDIEKIILVGGTTYIPYIRQELASRSGISVDTSIDPTTAVIVGAAFYAGSKQSELVEKSEAVVDHSAQKEMGVQLVFEPNSKDTEELIAVIISDPFEGFYRITREDGGFDTGLMKAGQKFTEFVPLLTKATNQFTVSLYDTQQNQVYSNNAVRITNGLYNVQGQPLPNDICLELDEERGKTYMERIFKKNEILPLKKTVYKLSSKNILKNSDEKLIINVVEGNSGSMVGSNQTIGYIEISGENFPHDLLKGMDIELNFKISESRDLSVSVYIGSLDLEINEVFNPHQRTVVVEKLISEIKDAIDDINSEIDFEAPEENYEYLAKLKRVQEHLIVLYDEAIACRNDNSTDKKYQLEEMKRILIQEYDDMVRHKHVLQELIEYNDTKAYFTEYLEKASPKQREEFDKITKNEKEVLQSNNKYLIRKKNQELESLLDAIYYNQSESIVNTYYFYMTKDEGEYKDVAKFRQLCSLGEKALEKTSYVELRAIYTQMYHLLKVKPARRDDFNTFDGNLGLK